MRKFQSSKVFSRFSINIIRMFCMRLTENSAFLLYETAKLKLADTIVKSTFFDN